MVASKRWTMDDLTKEFLQESSENLDRLDQDFVKLESDPGNPELVKSIFRTIHTIKGTCGFLGFTQLESVAHVGENLLSRLRDGEIALTPEITTALLQMVDAIRQMLQSIDSSGNEGERNDEALVRTLTSRQQGAAKPATESKELPGVVAQGLEERHPVRPEDEVTQAEAKPQTQAAKSKQGQREGAEIVGKPGESTAQKEPAQGQQAGKGSAADGAIRVDVGLLDKLMNLVGELVLARNQILQYSNATEDTGIVAPSQRLNLITTELQEGVMKTRMQPIGNIWSKFPRTVRDVATSCAKQVRIEMEGKETEPDKTIIEAIKDPLTHIVRNSVDHGIEIPDKRIAAGKPAEGRLLRAYHEGGQVNIEISDDGAGLDLEKIRRKAVEKGIITPEHSAKMSEREAANLIFLPGFSTAEKVTNVSGRGVGMDVVKTNIDKICGTVDVQSKLGAGTTVRMKIPLTLAIIPALIVTNRGERYAIPQISLLELVRLEG